MNGTKTIDEILTDFAHERNLAMANKTDMDAVYAKAKAELSKHMSEVVGAVPSGLTGDRAFGALRQIELACARALKISLCKNCWCMTKTNNGRCGKCKSRKDNK